METKTKKNRLRYFSSLNSLQKDKTYKMIRIFNEGLDGLNYGLSSEILKALPLDKVLNDLEKIDKLIKGQKIVFHKETKTYYPLNIKQILNELKN